MYGSDSIHNALCLEHVRVVKRHRSGYVVKISFGMIGDVSHT